MELRSLSLLLRLAGTLNRVLLPVDKAHGLFSVEVGNAIFIAPPGHLIFRELLECVLLQYKTECYEIINTGPGAMTNCFYKSGGCQRWAKEGVVLAYDLMDGHLVRHKRTGSWRSKAAEKRG